MDWMGYYSGVQIPACRQELGVNVKRGIETDSAVSFQRRQPKN